MRRRTTKRTRRLRKAEIIRRQNARRRRMRRLAETPGTLSSKLRRRMGDALADLFDEFGTKFYAEAVLALKETISSIFEDQMADLEATVKEELGRRGLEESAGHFSAWMHELVNTLTQFGMEDVSGSIEDLASRAAARYIQDEEAAKMEEDLSGEEEDVFDVEPEEVEEVEEVPEEEVEAPEEAEEAEPVALEELFGGEGEEEGEAAAMLHRGPRRMRRRAPRRHVRASSRRKRSRHRRRSKSASSELADVLQQHSSFVLGMEPDEYLEDALEAWSWASPSEAEEWITKARAWDGGAAEALKNVGLTPLDASKIVNFGGLKEPLGYWVSNNDISPEKAAKIAREKSAKVREREQSRIRRKAARILAELEE